MAPGLPASLSQILEYQLVFFLKRGRGRRRGRERISSGLHAEYGARHGAGSHNLEIMT